MDFLRTARNYIVYIILYLEYIVSFETTTLGNSGRPKIQALKTPGDPCYFITKKRRPTVYGMKV